MPLTDYLMHKMHFRCNKNWFKVGRRWFKIHLWHIFIQTFIQKWFRKKTMLVFLELQTGQKFLGPSVTLQNVQLLLGSTKCKRHYKLVQMFPMLRCLWPNTSVRHRWNTPSSSWSWSWRWWRVKWQVCCQDSVIVLLRRNETTRGHWYMWKPDILTKEDQL